MTPSTRSSLTIKAIVAMDDARVIGVKGGLPWKLPGDMKRFAALTKGHSVVMGRKTFDSLPPKFKPLPERKNIVISRSLKTLSGAEVWGLPDECIRHYRDHPELLPSSTLWIIGGDQIYKETIAEWDEVYLTRVPGVHEGDAWFPAFEERFELVSEEMGEGCTFLQYRARR